MVDIEKALNEVIHISKKAGQFLLQESQNFDTSKIETKGVKDFVSYADKQSEKMIVDKLSSLIPNAGFIAEEGSAKDNDNPYKWIIDPLDGTTNFIHSLPIFSTSIALMYKKKVILGVVYDICRDEMFYATENSKAYLNGNPIHTSAINQLDDSLLLCGFPYRQSDKSESYLKILDSFVKKTHGVRHFGSAAIDLVYVACGRLEGYYEYGLFPYDIAAGAIILEKSGGQISDFSGNSNHIFNGEVIAANNTKVHGLMLSEIKSKWK